MCVCVCVSYQITISSRTVKCIVKIINNIPSAIYNKQLLTMLRKGR